MYVSSAWEGKLIVCVENKIRTNKQKKNISSLEECVLSL